MKTRIAVSSVFALLLAGFGASALAQDSGFFVNGQIGSTDVDTNVGEEGDTSFGISVGYDINENFAVAIGYDDFGSFNIAGVSFDADGYNIRVIGSIPVHEDWSIFGQIGNQHWDVSGSAGGLTGSTDGDDLLLGIGGKWHAAEQFSLIGGYNFFEADNVDVDTWYLGGEYRFH